MHWKMKQTLNESKNHHIDETVKTAFKDFDMDSRVFLAKLKKFGFEKQYKKMLKNFNKHAKPGDGFYFIDGGRELGFQVHPVADMMLGPKIKKLGDTQDLGGGKTARLIAIKEDVQVVEQSYMPGQAKASHGGASRRGGSRGPRMSRQKKNRSEMLDLLALNGIQVLNQPQVVTGKGGSDTFVVAKKDVQKAKKVLDDYFEKPYVKIHMGKKGLRRDNYTIVAEGVRIDENKKGIVKFVVDADQNSYESITRDPALKKIPGFRGLHNIVFHPRKKKAEFTFRLLLGQLPKFQKLLKKHGLKLVDTIYEGSKKLDESKVYNPPKNSSAYYGKKSFAIVDRYGSIIRVGLSEKQARKLVQPGQMVDNLPGAKVGQVLKKNNVPDFYRESVQLDEALAARDIQGMIKGLNNKAKQEIAGVLNDMNLSGYGDYEARADNVHKFKPKDLLKAMNKVMKLEQANIVEFNDKFMKKGKYASKQDKAYNAKKRKEFERELKKAGIKFHFVAGNRKGPVEDTYYVSFKNNAKAHQIANKLFAGVVFSSKTRQFDIMAVSEVSFSEFSESVQLDEGSTIEFKFSNPMKAGAFMRRIMRDKLASEVDRYGGDRSPEEIVQVIMHPNDYERNDIERLAKRYKGELLEDLQIDEMSARDHYRRYKNKNRVSPIDRERFPNREREGLEGPYRTKKTGLIYYYDRKAGKYYDPQTDMYLDVDDIMESMGIKESDHYSKKDLYTDKDIKKLSKAYGNESYKGGFRGDKEDLPGAVKQMLRYISNYSNNDLIVIALADIPHASTQAKIELELLRGYKIKGRPPKKRSDFVKK